MYSSLFLMSILISSKWKRRFVDFATSSIHYWQNDSTTDLLYFWKIFWMGIIIRYVPHLQHNIVYPNSKQLLRLHSTKLMLDTRSKAIDEKQTINKILILCFAKT